jgi:hypothetical protein
MFARSTVLIFLIVFLTACAPKFNYLNPQTTEPAFDHILVVFDYLHLVDDVGELLDYPAEKNQQQLEKLKDVIESVLTKKGFKGTIDFALVSSGLGLNPETGYEHYIDGQLAEELIYPPFYMASPYDPSFQRQLIQSFADAQRVAFVPVSKKNQSFYDDLRMNALGFYALDEHMYPNLAADSAVGVLHIRAVMPRVSFMKAMGVSLLSAGLTAGATGGAYIGVATPMGVPHSTGLLFDNRTGEVVWKNQTGGDLSRAGEQTKERFFKEMPLLN